MDKIYMPMPFLPLSQPDAYLATVFSGLLVHAVLKYTETYEPTYISILLLAVPAALAPSLGPYSENLGQAMFKSFGVHWLSLFASILLYRISPWHPLARYPGPFLCRVTKIWFALISLKGKQHIYYYQLHEKYGDVVRVGPNELSIRNSAAVTPLMGPGGFAKGPFWEGRIPERETTKPLISLRDKMEHTRRRRPWTRAFNTTALKGYEPIVISRCLQLVDTLASKAGPVNLTQWIGYFTYDVMNDLGFGGGTDMIRDGDVNGLWHLLESGQRNSLFMGHVPWLGALFLRYPYFAGELKAFRANAQNSAKLRIKNGSLHKDLFYYLNDDGGFSSEKPSVAQVIGDAALAVVAGSDTTSSALLHLFYFLMCNPVAFNRLKAEVDGLGDDLMDSTKQTYLPYLNSAINESLRLYPPILSGSQRAAGKGAGGKAIGPYYVAEGTTVLIPTYSLHRDPRYFSPSPDMFLPERWLPREVRESLEPELFKDRDDFALETNAFIPFSTGPANCVGKNLAWLQMRMLVCLMVRKFEMRFAEGYRRERWHEEVQDYFITVKGQLPVVLTPRK